MHNCLKFVQVMAVAALVVIVPSMALAQGDTGRFSGTVLDQSGASVPGFSACQDAIPDRQITQ